MPTRPTLISLKASNWVDRGESPVPTIRRILAHFFDLHSDAPKHDLDAIAETVIGMVAADATEVHLAGYLRSIARTGRPEANDPPNARLAGIALWHVAKAALTRDTAERVLQSDVLTGMRNPGPLGDWLAARLLTPEELAAYEAEGARADDVAVREHRGRR